jgi:hypothetical protein
MRSRVSVVKSPSRSRAGCAAAGEEGSRIIWEPI